MQSTIPRVLIFLPFFLVGVLNASTKPNIILIFSDDHGYSDLGTQGIRSDLKTPNLDKLVEGGVRFTNGYVTAPQCVPSRAGLLIGKYQNRFGVEANKYPLKGFNAEHTIAERLKKAGYVTGMTGKWHLGPPNEITDHGFDFVYYKNANRPGWANFDLEGNDRKPGPENSKLYHLDANTEAACAFIKRNHNKPFFFYCAYRAPHVPLDAPEKYLSRFSKEMPKRRRQALAMIAAMDDGVGKIMATLREQKIEEKTLIFFIGDNGAPLKIHKIDAPGGGPGWDGSLNDPLNGEKGMLTEGGIRVPFVAYWKNRIAAGQTFDQPVFSLDVAATAHELAGLPEDQKLDGMNIIPFIGKNNVVMPKRKLYWRWISQSAIRNGKWKFLKGGTHEYLFDMDEDKEEKTNLIKKHPDIAKGLKKDLETWSTELMPQGIESRKLEGAWIRYFEHYLEGKLAPRPSANADSNPQTNNNVQGWVVRNGKLESKDGCLVVETLGEKNKRSFLAMSKLSVPPKSKAVIKLKTSVDGRVGVSWRLEGQKDFVAEQIQLVDTKASEEYQNVELGMKANKIIVHIRVLLPGKTNHIQSIQLVDKSGKSIKAGISENKLTYVLKTNQVIRPHMLFDRNGFGI